MQVITAWGHEAPGARLLQVLRAVQHTHTRLHSHARAHANTHLSCVVGWVENVDTWKVDLERSIPIGTQLGRVDWSSRRQYAQASNSDVDAAGPRSDQIRVFDHAAH